ncbi:MULTISPECIES: lactate racemase domain-containing protein [unclassified Archaeoglobus]|jgi:hypothetical protein|uniref:lactate racemase domain-containing protein n=1 Tax=unclassified Archaeoglobus TaxID=2643606 RepID=UPI0025C43A12|nr:MULTISPECIES: lactate racemase domain-containing protein [unclassified Archaeoglobus]
MREVIFNGDNVEIYDFPDEVDIIYPPEPISTSKPAREIVKKAIDDAELKMSKNSKVVIAFDDVSVPLPLPQTDPRRLMVKEILRKLKSMGIGKEQVTLVCATGMHRKCSNAELRQMLGEVVSAYRVVNHDCRDVVSLGETESGYIVEINRYAAESDVIIYLSVPFLPMNGGWKSIAVGLGSYACIRQHHLPDILTKSPYMNPHSDMHRIIEEIGRHVAEQIPVLHIDAVVNNSFYRGFVSKAWKNVRGEDRLDQKLLMSLSNMMPSSIKSRVRRRYRAGYEIAYVAAGEVDEVHSEVLQRVYEHRGLKIEKKYDALIFGLPNMSPYSVNSELNPILFHTMVRGYLCNMFEKMLRKRAFFVVQNPVYEVFDEKQHPAYREFYCKYISKGKTDFDEIESAERQLVENSKLMNAYGNGFAYHPAHAVIAYYWGALGMERLEKVVVAGSKSTALKPLGFESAEDMDEAIKILKEMGCGKIAYVCLPPVFFAY